MTAIVTSTASATWSANPMISVKIDTCYQPLPAFLSGGQRLAGIKNRVFLFIIAHIRNQSASTRLLQKR
jgi:hypothetical protein